MALSVLQIPITEIDNYLSDLHYNDNLVYHYAGGVAFAALKKWEEAEEFFEICVSSPAQVPAAIQLEAYKKLTLVQLISRGTVSLCPLTSAPSPALNFRIKDACCSKIHQQFSSSAAKSIAIRGICEGISTANWDLEESR